VEMPPSESVDDLMNFPEFWQQDKEWQELQTGDLIDY